MFTNTISNKWSDTIEKSVPTIELISFDIGEIKLGIPITKIERIISNIHLDLDDTLTENVNIIDLHDRLTGSAITNPTAIVIFTSDRQRSGTPINTAPTILAIPCDSIRTLPTEFRTTNLLGIASHIAMIADPTRELTMFILGN